MSQISEIRIKLLSAISFNLSVGNVFIICRLRVFNDSARSTCINERCTLLVYGVISRGILFSKSKTPAIIKARLNIASELKTAYPSFRKNFDKFKEALSEFLKRINIKESEEHNKIFIIQFLKNSFYSEKHVNTKEKADLTIHLK